MKNLKKVLALGLALIMLLGMFTVVSAAETKKTASDLTDWNTVEHKDAVSLMVDLGIIIGDEKGAFNPTGNIDRSSWAKMVYYAATGSSDADAYLGTASGLNDIAGDWAESYISFLKANNYISGDNLGNYNPKESITVAAACKMMLTVLGYDAEDRHYQNDNAWAGNIMADARRNGLMDNVDSNMTSMTPLTRENAAEIVLNALNANMVEGEPQWDNGEKHIAKYSKLNTLGYDVFGLIKVTATVSKIDSDNLATLVSVTSPVLTGTETPWTGVLPSIQNKIKATSDMVGEEVDVYVKATNVRWADNGEISAFGKFVNVVSTSASHATATPAAVITSGTSLTAVTTNTSADYVAKYFATDPACKYYLNGREVDMDIAANATTFAAEMAKRGTVAEFYLDVNGDIGTVKVYSYTADKVDGTVTTKTTSDGTVQVRIPGVQYLSGWVDADKVSGWQDLEDGDVILYYRTLLDGTTYSYNIEKAEKVTGKVTTYSDKGVLTINSKSYRASEQGCDGSAFDLVGSENTFADWLNGQTLTDEYDFYLDKNGSIIAMDQITESTDASRVCLVLETQVQDGTLGANGALAANLLFADGSTEIVKISKVSTSGATGLKSVVDEGKMSTNETTAARQIEADDAEKILLGAGEKTRFFNYKSTSSGYELTLMNTAVNGGKSWKNVVTYDDATVYVAKESSFAKTDSARTVALTTDKMLTANNSTTFIVGKADVNGDYKYSVYKGFKNVPQMDAALVTAIAAADPTAPDAAVTVAKFVYLDTNKSFRDEVPEGYIFVIDGGWTVDNELADDGVYRINIVDTDGTVTTMRATEEIKNHVKGEASSALSATTNYIRNFWAVGEMDENGTVSVLTNEDADNVNQKAVTISPVTGMGDGVVNFEDEDLNCDYDSATKFIFVDLGWADGDGVDNQLGVREDTKDRFVVADSGSFNPENFYNASEVNADSTSGATYEKILGTSIKPLNSTTADYVYVVRFLW